MYAAKKNVCFDDGDDMVDRTVNVTVNYIESPFSCMCVRACVCVIDIPNIPQFTSIIVCLQYLPTNLWLNYYDHINVRKFKFFSAWSKMKNDFAEEKKLMIAETFFALNTKQKCQ